jgi:AraC-like DNA-binding protein
MNRIRVLAHGLWREEPVGFTVDRPYGLGLFLLVRFHSPMEVITAQGLTSAEPGHCILFSPEHPQWYRGREGAWFNDWMHIEGEAVSAVAARHGVPLNTLLLPGNTHFWPHIFEEITHEQQHAEANWEEAVELLVAQLLLKLGRALTDPGAKFTPTEAEHLLALRALRWHIHEQLARRWTVGEMAAEVGLSRSRFAGLYQKFFGVSPVEDLLRVRLRHAQTLLTNRALSIGEVATQSGFNSVHYFSDVFHQRVGCAPRDYHQHGNHLHTTLRDSSHPSNER